jgi:WD40 repeat protein
VARRLGLATAAERPARHRAVRDGPNTAGLWEADSGELFSYLYGHDPNSKLRLTSAAFSPDGRTILTASRDRTVRTYDCDVCTDLPGLVALSRSRLAGTGRTLTRAERLRYLGATEH